VDSYQYEKFQPVIKEVFPDITLASTANGKDMFFEGKTCRNVLLKYKDEETDL
jgi:hypothetical protein